MDKTPLRKLELNLTNRLLKQKQLADITTPYKIPGSPLMKKLGYGTGVAVYLLNASSKKAKSSASPWAIKKCLKEKTEKTYSQRLAAEADILRTLSHPNVVGFRAFQKADDGRYNLAMEACTMSLGDLIEKRFSDALGPLEVNNINIMGFDISKALNYLHNEALLIHGDMKSFNILIKGEFVVCKLCDFGVSIPITKEGVIDFVKNPKAHYTGTDLWNAPEVFEEDAELITTRTEIFSFGLVLYECIALVPPHTLNMASGNGKKVLDFDDCEDEDDEEDDEDVLDFMVGTRPAFPEGIKLPKEYNDILQLFYLCTDEDPESRPSAEKIEHIFKEFKIVIDIL